jgi:uncharacterized sulfatase
MDRTMNLTFMRRIVLQCIALSFMAAATSLVWAAGFDYGLRPQQVADDTWVLLGRNEDFNVANGGNIVNTAFVVTGAGVVVIDSGPSRRYGEQLRRAIASITDEPIVRVIITHYHPDHFLGNQAFDPKTLYALPLTISSITRDGNGFSENLYRLCGDWMLGTEVSAPQQSIAPGPLVIGSHRFEVLALDGHTGTDLALFDQGTGVLFAGDLVFNGRAPTTPHAHIDRWLAALDRLEALAPRIVVPGHGAVNTSASGKSSAIDQTRAYLRWLDASLNRAAEQGLDMSEALLLPLSAEVRALAVAEAEFRRSVSHLYPAAEQRALTRPHRH